MHLVRRFVFLVANYLFIPQINKENLLCFTDVQDFLQGESDIETFVFVNITRGIETK